MFQQNVYCIKIHATEVVFQKNVYCIKIRATEVVFPYLEREIEFLNVNNVAG